MVTPRVKLCRLKLKTNNIIPSEGAVRYWNCWCKKEKSLKKQQTYCNTAYICCDKLCGAFCRINAWMKKNPTTPASWMERSTSSSEAEDGACLTTAYWNHTGVSTEIMTLDLPSSQHSTTRRSSSSTRRAAMVRSMILSPFTENTRMSWLVSMIAAKPPLWQLKDVPLNLFHDHHCLVAIFFFFFFIKII